MVASDTHSHSFRATALVVAAASTSGIGAVALLGWMLDMSSLAAWKAGTVPMAPVTAVLSILFGMALWLGTRPSSESARRNPASVLASAGILTTLMLLGLRLSKVSPSAERLGLRLSGPDGLDPTTGFISPITAAGFLLAFATLLFALSSSQRFKIPSWGTLVAAGLIANAGFVLMLISLFGPPLLSSAGILPVALNSGLVLLLMGLALIIAGGHPLDEALGSPEASRRGGAVYTSIFAAAAVLAIVGAYAYYRAEEQALHGQAEHELDAISQLKVSQLQEWRRERLAAASLIDHNPLVSSLARRLVSQPGDVATRHQFELWWQRNQAQLQSDAFVLTDVRGDTVLSAPSGVAPPSALLSAGLRAGEVGVVDFYLDRRDQRVYLATLVPIREAAPADGIIGVLMIRLDPQRFLYPFMARSLGRSTTAETLLVRRDGEFVQFLSPLKFDAGAPLSKRISLDEGRVLAVKAVLGQTGLLEGLDYRGAPVLGVARAVAGSPWFLVARKDIAEFRGELWRRFWMVTTFATIAVLAVAAGLGLVWRDQSARFYRSRANLANELRESEDRYRRYIESATDTVFELTPAGLITFVSPNWADMMGEPGTEAIGKSLAQYVHPDDVHRCRVYLAQCLAANCSGEGLEYRTLHRDGTVHWHAVRGAALRDREGRVIGGMGIARDITERVDVERKAAQIKERLELATRAADIGIWDWEIDTGAIIWDARMFQLYGWPSNSSRVDYAGWMASVHPGDRERVDADVRRALPGLSAYVSEFRAVWPDGTVRRIAAVGHVTLDERGRPVRMLGVNYDVTERWAADSRLRSLVLEKEALLREVHHRVKNNLQVITSLLRLEADRASQPHTRQVLRDMQGRIFAMASLHESLYRANQFDRVELADYIRRVCTQLFHSAVTRPGAVELSFDLVPVDIQIHQAIACGLLVNELVSNSLKHGFPDGRSGTIRVELQSADDGTRLELSVRDTGVGLPPDFSKRRAASLGLQLVADLARQLHGVLEIGPAPGAAFRLGFSPEPGPSRGAKVNDDGQNPNPDC